MVSLLQQVLGHRVPNCCATPGAPRLKFTTLVQRMVGTTIIVATTGAVWWVSLPPLQRYSWIGSRRRVVRVVGGHNGVVVVRSVLLLRGSQVVSSLQGLDRMDRKMPVDMVHQGGAFVLVGTPQFFTVGAAEAGASTEDEKENAAEDSDDYFPDHRRCEPIDDFVHQGSVMQQQHNDSSIQ